jgi:hypothetical protein
MLWPTELVPHGIAKIGRLNFTHPTSFSFNRHDFYHSFPDSSFTILKIEFMA